MTLIACNAKRKTLLSKMDFSVPSPSTVSTCFHTQALSAFTLLTDDTVLTLEY